MNLYLYSIIIIINTYLINKYYTIIMIRNMSQFLNDRCVQNQFFRIRLILVCCIGLSFYQHGFNTGGFVCFQSSQFEKRLQEERQRAEQAEKEYDEVCKLFVIQKAINFSSSGFLQQTELSFQQSRWKSPSVRVTGTHFTLLLPTCDCVTSCFLLTTTCTFSFFISVSIGFVMSFISFFLLH